MKVKSGSVGCQTLECPVQCGTVGCQTPVKYLLCTKCRYMNIYIYGCL